MKRCKWCSSDPIYIDYHDLEWGKECHDDQKLFAMLILEGAQAGLSWITILKKRDNYYQAYDNFDVHKVASFDDTKINELLNNAGIIRNKLKITSSINNAKCFIKIQEEFGSFNNYLWSYVDFKPIINFKPFPTTSELSDLISKDLKKRGFKFVGSTIIYSYLEAVGVINDHEDDCDFKYN